jgi:hypothetical protein
MRATTIQTQAGTPPRRCVAVSRTRSYRAIG